MTLTNDKKQIPQGPGPSEYRHRLFLKEVILPQANPAPGNMRVILRTIGLAYLCLRVLCKWVHKCLPQKPVGNGDCTHKP